MPSRNSFTDSRILAISRSQFWLKEGSINLDGALMQSVAFAPCVIVVNGVLMARLRQAAMVSADVGRLWHFRHCERNEAIHLCDRNEHQIDGRVALLLALVQVHKFADRNVRLSRRLSEVGVVRP
jgi:hypothetical protein